MCISKEIKSSNNDTSTGEQVRQDKKDHLLGGRKSSIEPSKGGCVGRSRSFTRGVSVWTYRRSSGIFDEDEDEDEADERGGILVRSRIGIGRSLYSRGGRKKRSKKKKKYSMDGVRRDEKYLEGVEPW